MKRGLGKIGALITALLALGVLCGCGSETEGSVSWNADGYGSYGKDGTKIAWLAVEDSKVLSVKSESGQLTLLRESANIPRESFNYVKNADESGVIVTGCESSKSKIMIPERAYGVPVTGIGEWAFERCDSLKSITIPASVTSIGNAAFSSCSSLTSITIPASVTSIGHGAFSRCSSLTSITIPDGVTSIGYQAFRSCSSLTSITIPASVVSIGDDEGGAFSGCTKLVSLVVSQGNKKYYSENNCIIERETKILIEGCKNSIIPEGVISIGAGAFDSCGLTSITIPESVTSIGYGAFADRELTSITIPESVTSIGDFAFGGCSSLTSITIPASVTSIGDRAFRDCSSLTSITIPAKVTNIGAYEFECCSSLTSITIPASVKSIGYGAFSYCSSLTDITFRGTKKQWKAIDKDYQWDLETPSYTIHCTDGDIQES